MQIGQNQNPLYFSLQDLIASSTLSIRGASYARLAADFRRKEAGTKTPLKVLELYHRAFSFGEFRLFLDVSDVVCVEVAHPTTLNV